jgi:RNA polymerase sigma factor (sigma-70 family)
MTEKEKTLLAGCIAGEKAGWEEFVRQYSNLVYHTIRKTLTLHHTEFRAEMVEDLYQEFFVSILQNNCRRLTQFRGDGSCTLASWLRVVASRQTIDFLRKQPASLVKQSDASSPDLSDTLIAINEQERDQSLTQVLGTLCPRESLIIDLTFRRRLPAEEIASILDISVGAFYTQKSRLLDKLRELLRNAPRL